MDPNYNIPAMKRPKIDNPINGDIRGLYSVDLGGHPIANDPMYAGRPPMQQQGMYGMNTGQRVVDHGGYPMNHGMMSQQQQQQMGYRNTPQSAMANQGRMVGPFAASVSPNAVVGANNNPQMISSMNAHAGMNQYPPGMMNRPQAQQQQQQQQQQMIGMSPNPGGMRMGSPSTGTHLGPISTSGDPTPFQPPISGNNLGMYNRAPNPGGGGLGAQNSAATAGQKRNSLSPYQYRTPSYSPNSTPPAGPTQASFQSTPPPPSYNSTSNSLPSVNQASTYQVVPPNQTAPNNSNQLPLPSTPAQEASNSPRSAPGTPTTSTVHSQDTASSSQLSPLTVMGNDTSVSGTSSQKASNTDLAASGVSQDSTVASQASSQQAVNSDGVTSTASTSNPNSEHLSDSYHSLTSSMQPLSAGSSLSSSNAFAISTGNSNAMMSSGTINNGIANNVSSTSSASLDSDLSNMKGTAGGAGGGLANPQSDPEKRKLIQQQLVLLLHAHKCQRREREQANNPEYQACRLAHCRTMKNVLNHMTECADGKACQVPHCASSRQIIQHWKNCSRPDCPVCQPLKGATAMGGRSQFNVPVANPHQGGGAGAGGMDMMMPSPSQRPPEFQQPGMNMPMNPRMDSYWGADGHGMQNNPNINNQSVANLMRGPSMVDQPIQGAQSWHQDVSADLRQHLVRKLVTTIYPVQDQTALQDRRVMSLIQYAKKVEKSMFEVARSREQYYELLAEKIYKIQKELEERRTRVMMQGGNKGMPIGSEYNMGSDPALWPGGSGGPMPGMPGGNIGGSPYPMNPGTPYAGMDMAGYNQQQKTPNMMIPSSPATQMDAFLQSLSSPIRPPPSVPPPSVPGVPPSPANRPEQPKAGGEFNQKLQNIGGGGDLYGSKDQLLDMSVPSVGKQQPPSVKETGGKSASFPGKNSELSTMEATSSDAASSTAATSTTHGNGLGGKPASVSSPSQQQLPSSSMVKREIKQEMDTSSFQPSRHNSVSSVANTPAEVKQEVKTETASPAPHMSPALRRASSAGVPLKADVKIPKKEFSPEDLLDVLSPVLDMLYDQFPDCLPFRQPVDPVLLQIPDYFDIIKNPIDLSTISKRLEEGSYKTPWEFCEDIWLMFDNCWTYNKKNTRVYKMGMKLSEVFDIHIDEAMVKLGYCCGRRYAFSPQVLYCYSRNVCPISRDATYWSYQNRYVFCTKCFSEMQGDTVTVGEDLNSSSQIEKSLFIEMKNNSIEKEPMVSCVHCGRKMHRICVLYFEPLWPEGYHCHTCAKKLGMPKKENKFSAKRLATTRLGSFLEDRVNNFLRQSNVDTGEITIRLVSNTEKTLETRSGMKSRFGSDFPAQFPYKAKAMFVFQEHDGVDLCIFGMHVQEYGSDCPSPNSRRVYISYLDSVHYFHPKQYRTLVYHEILIGYLEHVRTLGYDTAHIWACPPSEGDDYIYHCHPPEQKIPKPRRLQEWYRKMIERAKADKVVYDWKDMHRQSMDDDLSSVTELPYFEGDFWPNVIEEQIKELDQEEKAQASGEGRGSKKATSKKASSKKNSKKAVIPAGSCDLSQRIFNIMEKHKEVFFVIYLQTPNVEALPSTVDSDPIMVCDLMEGRDSFLTMARERHLEFSSLRRTKYSTRVMLYELHNQGSAGFVYTCNTCRMHVETRYHCLECEDFDLCVTCYREKGHEHKMEKLGLGLEFESESEPQQTQNPHEARKQSIQKCIQSLVHACQCRDMSCKLQSCIKMKRVIRHTRDCRLRNNGNCSICKQFVALCLYHARNCKETRCSVPLCSNIKQKLEKQRREQQIHQDRLIMRRMVEMRAHSGAPTPSAHVAASPAPNTPRRAQQKSPSESPHPSVSNASASPKPKPQQQSPGEGGTSTGGGGKAGGGKAGGGKAGGGKAGGGKAMGNMTGMGPSAPTTAMDSTPPQQQKPPPVNAPNMNSPSQALQMQQQQQQQQMTDSGMGLDLLGMQHQHQQQPTARNYAQMADMAMSQQPQHVQQVAARQQLMGGGGVSAYQGHYTNQRVMHQPSQQQYLSQQQQQHQQHQQQQQQMYLHQMRQQHQQQQRQQQFLNATAGGGYQGQYGGDTRVLHQAPQQYHPAQQQHMYAQTPQGPVSNHHMMPHQTYHQSMHPQMVGHHGTGPPPYPGGRNPMMGQGQRMVAAGPGMMQQQQQQQLQYIQQQQQQQHAQMQGDLMTMTKTDQLQKLVDTL